MSFKRIKTEDIQKNPFSMISRQWMLVTAGTPDSCNTLTASWGGVGYIWNKNAATIYIRPSRYTKKFLDENSTFSLSFLPEEYRAALNLCGTVSGRDCNKIEEAGLHIDFYEGTPYFQEAEMVFVCKKMYVEDMKPENLLINPAPFYPEGDYHCIYISEILEVLEKE